MKPSAAAIFGAISFLVLFVASLAGGALIVAAGKPLASLPCVVMAAIIGYGVVSSDWPRVWKPLLTGNKS